LRGNFVLLKDGFLESVRRRLLAAEKRFGWEAHLATAEQIKALVCSRLSGDNERFDTVALQVAAHEA
jgi:hypothetical protein